MRDTPVLDRDRGTKFASGEPGLYPGIPRMPTTHFRAVFVRRGGF